MSVSLPQAAPAPPEEGASERAAGTEGAPGLVVLGDGDAPGCADGVCAL
jgi:hypothetical protein